MFEDRQRSLNLLWPPFKEKVLRGLHLARSQGLQVYVFESWRSGARQNNLYSQGRTTPGRIITRARAGYSWHYYGLAVDLVFDGHARPGIQWSWDGDYIGKKEGDYKRLGKIITTLDDIEWYGQPGSSFYETPHFQMTMGMDILEAKRLADAGGLPAVWVELEKRLKGES